MLELGIHSWDYDDGSVGAALDLAPEGDIWAKDDATLQASMNRLVRIFVTAVILREQGRALEEKRAEMDIGFQAGRFEDKYAVCWRDLPDFYILFDNEAGMRRWLAVLAGFAKAITWQERQMAGKLN